MPSFFLGKVAKWTSPDAMVMDPKGNSHLDTSWISRAVQAKWVAVPPLNGTTISLGHMNSSKHSLHTIDNTTLSPSRLADLISSNGTGTSQSGHLTNPFRVPSFGQVIGHQSMLTLMAVGGGMILLLIILILIRKSRYFKYHRVPTWESNGYLYIYKPLVGHKELDEEYENTFVGVSVPLLQETTKIWHWKILPFVIPMSVQETVTYFMGDFRDISVLL